MGWMLIIGFSLFLIICLAMFTSCSPRVIENIQYKHDTTFVEKVRVDSLVQRDSVFVREKGDTIYIYKEKVRDRWRLVRDTIRVVKVDSVAVETIKEVQVEKPLSAWRSFEIRAFWWLLAAVLVLLLWVFRKPLLKLISI